MTSPLEASVTLDDVFSVVAAKRVPLAPELAGYLALEIADGADASGGEVDPRTVYIGEEGSVALVRPKKENATGDAEASVRAILVRLLEASGSSTPGLGAVAKRKPGHGLRGLVQEIEAALIPVNRSAGRRALARLAREVKRVTLGVGRNASVPAPARPSSAPPSSSHGAAAAGNELTLTAPKLPRFEEEEAVTAKRPSEAVAENRAELLAGIAPPTPPRPLPPLPTPPREAPPTPMPAPQGRPAAVPDLKPGQDVFAGDEVESLLATFEVSKNEGDKAVSRELKAMIGLDPTPPPPAASVLAAMTAPAAARHRSADGVEDLLALADPSEPPPPPRSPQKAPAQSPPPAPPPSEPRLAAKPPPPKPARPPEAKTAPKPPAAPPPPAKRSGSRAEPRAPKTSAALLIVALLALGAGTAAMWKLKPGFFTGRTPEKIAQEKAAAEQARQQSLLAAQTQRCKVTLLVGDVPPNAEVLLRVGQAPIDVERMPIGTRLEFVATAEGFAPKRAIVPADAAWDKGPEGKPRFELGVQLDPAKAKPGAVDPWPAGEPGSEVGGKGAPGTVHIVATPRGAEAWLLTGVGPEARIEQLKCETDVDVLVAGPTSFRKRLRVSAADIQGAALDGQGSHLVKVSAK